jgi:hypothetical protein
MLCSHIYPFTNYRFAAENTYLGTKKNPVCESNYFRAKSSQCCKSEYALVSCRMDDIEMAEHLDSITMRFTRTKVHDE